MRLDSPDHDIERLGEGTDLVSAGDPAHAHVEVPGTKLLHRRVQPANRVGQPDRDGQYDGEDQHQLTQQPGQKEVLDQFDGLALVPVGEVDSGQQKRAQQPGKGRDIDLHEKRW